MQGTEIAFEFHLSFQKMQEHQLIGPFSYCPNPPPALGHLFSYWMMNILVFSHIF